MSFQGYYEPQYIQPGRYSYDSDLESPNGAEYNPHDPRGYYGRHNSQGFSTYHLHHDFDHSYESQRYDSSAPSNAYMDGRHGGMYASSPVSTGASTMSRHGSNASAISPVQARHSRSPSSSGEKPYCEHPECLDDYGLPKKFFSRKADLARHEKSQHQPPNMDCPKNKCTRKGENGFTRKDHLDEHRRQYHGDPLPKRGGGSGRKQSSSRHS